MCSVFVYRLAIVPSLVQFAMRLALTDIRNRRQVLVVSCIGAFAEERGNYHSARVNIYVTFARTVAVVIYNDTLRATTPCNCLL